MASAKAAGVPGETVKPQNVVIIDSEDIEVEQTGTWTEVSDHRASGLTYIYSDVEGDSLSLRFRGTGLWLRYFAVPDGGKASISVDGGAAKTLDCYAVTKRVLVAFVDPNLSPGTHTVEVKVTSTKNPSSAGYKIAIDAFIIELSRGSQQIWAMIEQQVETLTAASSENESGVLDAHTFSAASTWETLKEFDIDWREEQVISAMLRRYIKVKAKFRNDHASNSYKGAIRILENDNFLREQSITIAPGGTSVVQVETMQPLLFFAQSTIKIQGWVQNTAVTLVADADNSRWDTQRRFGLEETLRQEYSPLLVGAAVWETPTIIPYFTQEEFEKGWFKMMWDESTVYPYVDSGRYLHIPNRTDVGLLGNVQFGHLHGLSMKWGTSPQAGAEESIGFDFPEWLFGFIGFRIDGTKFQTMTKDLTGEQTTDLTWSDGYKTAYHHYSIEWRPDVVRFYIDGVLVAKHTENIPQDPAGLVFMNYETFATTELIIQPGFELENLAGNVPIKEKAEALCINVSSIAASGEAHFDLDLLRHASLAVSCRVTYSASATAGVRVYLLASEDETNWDSENITDAFTYFEPSFAAGATRQRTVNIDALPRYIRVLVRNLDGSYATGAVKVWVCRESD